MKVHIVALVLLLCSAFVSAASAQVRSTVRDVSEAGPEGKPADKAQASVESTSESVIGAQRTSSSPSESDYSRVYRAFLEVQQRRTAVPRDASSRSDYIRKVRAAMALADDTPTGVRYLLIWNHAALDATAMDHNTLSGSFQEQFGPTRTSRALAIVHLSMFEAVNSISRKYPSYRNLQQQVLTNVGLPPNRVTPMTTSIDRAVVEAAFQTLIALYPKKTDFFMTSLVHDRTELGDIPDGSGNRPANMILGERVGAAAAKAVLQLRKFDRSEFTDPPSDVFMSGDARTWQKDPISKLAPALGAN